MLDKLKKEEVVSSIICNKLGTETFKIFDDLNIEITMNDIYDMIYNHFENKNEQNTNKKETRQTMERDN